MMCEHCEKTVSEAAMSVKGVTKASSDHKKGQVKISYDTSITDLEVIKKAIAASGYEVVDEEEACPVPVRQAVTIPKVKEEAKSGGIQKTTLKLTGMTCASCAQNIEKVLNKIDGVRKATVNFSVEKATIEYDAGKVNPAAFDNAIIGIGYGVAKPETTLKIGGMHCASCALN